MTSEHDTPAVTSEAQPPTTIREAATATSDLFGGIKRWVADNSDALANFLRLAHRHMIFDRAGWIPHYTTPFSLIDDDVSEDRLSTLLDGYYREAWPLVSADFRSKLAGLAVDDEAKATFSEALNAHGQGYFRATVRLVFPEIERVARVDLMDGTLAGIASLTEVRDAAGNTLGFSEIGPKGGGPSFAQFSRMMHHLYETAHTPERIAELAKDPVPNRHAALHGLVIYRTMQSSLNALMMTEFMFQVVSALKANAAERAASSARP